MAGLFGKKAAQDPVVRLLRRLIFAELLFCAAYGVFVFLPWALFLRDALPGRGDELVFGRVVGPSVLGAWGFVLWLLWEYLRPIVSLTRGKDAGAQITDAALASAADAVWSTPRRQLRYRMLLGSGLTGALHCYLSIKHPYPRFRSPPCSL